MSRSDIVRSHLRNGELLLAREAADACLDGASEDAEKGEIYALLSRAWCRLGDPKKAMEAAERAAALTDHWEANLALAAALVGLGQPVPARSLLSNTLQQARDSGSEARPAAGLVRAEIEVGTMLAEACRAAGDPETGLGIATRAVAWAERYLGKSAPGTADALYGLGVCLHGAAQYEEAKRALTRALVTRQSHAPDTSDVAVTLDALGAVERNLKKPFKAKELHEKALAIWVKTVGKHASPVGACRHSYAQALHRTGDFVGAREQMSQAAYITAKVLGDDHVDTWITRFELGRFDVDTGEFETGFALMAKARKIVGERLGEHHPVVKAMDRWL
jgi:tetratricopeptide (TPR) repeat protein